MSSPPVDAGTPHGRIPPEEIQRIVRQNFPRFKVCYQEALQRDPHMKGCVKTQFTIDLTGRATSATDIAEESVAVPDEGMRRCIARTFETLTFPPPEGGVVHVVYPLEFKPDDSDASKLCKPDRDAGPAAGVNPSP